VCGIAPGPIGETEGVRRLAPGGVTDRMKAAIPAGRFGGIDEIAAAAVFLRSPAAAYITGHILVVDGGMCISRPAARYLAVTRRRGPAAAGRAASTGAGPLDVAAPARQIAVELIAGRGHYDRVIRAVLDAHTSVWIATANLKELMIDDGRAAPGRRRSLGRASYVSILARLDELAARGVELRLLHAELPSRPFRAELARRPRLVAGGLALRRCPRVHLKAVVVDGELLYPRQRQLDRRRPRRPRQRPPQLRARHRHRRRAAARSGPVDVRPDLDRRRVRDLQAPRRLPRPARRPRDRAGDRRATSGARADDRRPAEDPARPAPPPAARLIAQEQSRALVRRSACLRSQSTMTSQSIQPLARTRNRRPAVGHHLAT